MSIRNLESLFQPASVALVGGTENMASVGGVLTRNLLEGGFEGPRYIVNHHRDRVRGARAWKRVGDLPEAPELAVIAIPPRGVPEVVDELCRIGTRAAVVISAGFAELGTRAGRRLQKRILEASRPGLLRVLGPNSVGMVAPHCGLNASFAHLQPRPGKLACVSQSGAVLTAMLDWAESHGIGFSAMVSLGNAADVDAGDLLDYLALDKNTSAILLYIEGLSEARKFMSAARSAARAKPVIVVKSGRHAASARAAASHTAALAGGDDVFSAALRRAGLLRVDALEELFEAAEYLSMARIPEGRRMAVLTNGGGVGVIAADALVEAGAELAELSEDTLSALDEVLPPTWSRANPVDIIGDAPPERYAQALAPLQDDPGVDGILALNAPTAMASSQDAARALADAADRDRPALVTAWIGEHEAAAARSFFAGRRIPSYAMPEQAVRALMYGLRFRRNQEILLETPPSQPEDFTPDTEAARALIRHALEAGRDWLDESESRRLLDAYDIPGVMAWRVSGPAQAAAVAREHGRPVAVKVLSPQIVHKSEAGAVMLDVEPDQVEAVATAALERLERTHPDAEITGLSVQAMVDRENAWELFAGIVCDRLFGPVIVFGEGGVAVEVIGDRAIGLPPLNMHLADDMVSRTRIDRRLRGFRHRPAADREALCFTLVKLGRIAADLPEVVELDINPLVTSPTGVVALDARVRLEAVDDPDVRRLPIRPYPAELETTVETVDGETFRIRPVRPEDEPALVALFRRLTPEEIRYRFLGPVKVLTHHQAARFVQLDYDREMALVLLDPNGEDIQGVVRISADPDNVEAEYAILVARQLAGRGLGTQLMERMIDYARQRGLERLVGRVLADNQNMLDICRRLGFECHHDPEEPSVVEVVLDLGQ